MIQGALQADCDIARAYGEAHLDSWVGMGFENEPTVRIVALFTGDVAPYDRELRHLVAHPDHLALRSCPYTHAQLQATRAEIDEMGAERAAETGRPVMVGIGEGLGAIQVRLRADQENFAAELEERYGAMIEVQVGAFSFPERRRLHRSKPPRALEDAGIDGLELRLEVDQVLLEAGDDSHGRVVFHNAGDRRIGPLHGSQPLVGALIDDTGAVVGGYSGRIAGTGLTLDLSPGTTTTVRFVFGTASFRENLGYVLPPGEYRLQVGFPFHHEIAGPPTHRATAPSTRVGVTARRP